MSGYGLARRDESTGPKEWRINQVSARDIAQVWDAGGRSGKLNTIRNKAFTWFFPATMIVFFLTFFGVLPFFLIFLWMFLGIPTLIGFTSYAQSKLLQVDNEAVIKAISNEHKSYLLDRMVEDSKIPYHLNVDKALLLWEKAETIGGPLESEIHGMLMAMADNAARNPESPPKRQFWVMSVGNVPPPSFFQTNRWSENPDNESVDKMLAKVETIILERKRVEAAVAGVDDLSVENPAKWSFDRAMEEAEKEAHLLRAVADDLNDKNDGRENQLPKS